MTETKFTKINGQELFERMGKPRKIVAPMVDQSELAWRILSRRHGATLCYTPMFHARLFATSEKYRRDMWCDLDGDPKYDRPLVVQFCANDPAHLLDAARLVQDKCDAVDLNLGCPQGIAKKGHYGSFLMDEWDLISKLINTLHMSLDVPVTAKFRVFADKERTLQYAQMILDAGAQFLTVHGRLREQKGQKTGLADWEIIKYLRQNLPPQTIIFANGNILYPEDMDRCLKYTKCDAIMSAEGNLYNPGLFDGSNQKEKTFPRVDQIARELFEIVKEECPNSRASRNALKSHMFKILRPFLQEHTDIRSLLAKMSPKHSFQDWENQIIIPIERTVSELMNAPGFEARDIFTQGELQPWGGRYWNVPYWRCQPYFRPVNGVTGDKRVLEQLTGKQKSNTIEHQELGTLLKKRKVIDTK